jgi:hypothetical protein
LLAMCSFGVRHGSNGKVVTCRIGSLRNGDTETHALYNTYRSKLLPLCVACCLGHKLGIKCGLCRSQTGRLFPRPEWEFVSCLRPAPARPGIGPPSGLSAPRLSHQVSRPFHFPAQPLGKLGCRGLKVANVNAAGQSWGGGGGGCRCLEAV